MSSIVGEMLLLTMAVVIIAVISVNAQVLLPPPREPVVWIFQNSTANTVTLIHKGGDAVRVGDLRVLINGTENTTFLLNGDRPADPDWLFDLGDRIEVGMPGGGFLPGGTTIQLATRRAVLYSGVIP